MFDLLELWLVRHGETDWNVEQRIQGAANVPLNQRGVRQAHLLGEALRDRDFDYVYSSDLSRAFETATILNQYVEVPITSCEILRERSFGKAEGLLRSTALRRYPNGYPGMESEEALRKRAERFLLHIKRQHLQGRMLCVSHGNFIGSLLDLVGHQQVEKLSNTSVSCLRIYDNEIEVLKVNWSEHLENVGLRMEDLTNP